MTIRDILIYFSFKYEGDYEKIMKAIKTKETIDMDFYNKIDFSINCITILDNNYPEEFKQLYKPPLILYYEGDINLLFYKKKLSVVGTRKPSSYGKKVMHMIINEVLKMEDVLIVSGLARGIDTLAHTLCLENKRKTIAVLAQGIDKYYLKNNQELLDRIKQEGLVISEYPPGVKIKKENFSFRNRIIAVLSKNIFVPEANSKSGTSITLNYALELGRNVLCVPKNIDADSLCNTFISQGAKPIISFYDVLEDL